MEIAKQNDQLKGGIIFGIVVLMLSWLSEMVGCLYDLRFCHWGGSV